MSAVHPEKTPPSLIVVNGELQGQRFPLGRGPAHIGRSRECEIQLDLGSISRKHAVIEQAEGLFFVRDLGSRNGVKLSGRPIDRSELHDGDIITVGQVDLRFESPPPPAMAPVETATEAAAIQPEAMQTAVPGRVLTVSDIVAAAQAENFAADRGPGSSTTEPPAGLNVKLIALVVIALVLSVAVGAFILAQGGRKGKTEVIRLSSFNIKAGGNKWLSLSRALGTFSNENIEVEDETVVNARKYDKHELVIHGIARGTTTVNITTKKGRRVSVMVFVRGRIEDPLEQLARERFVNDAERRRRAQSYYEAGRVAEAKRPYLALMEYRKAETVLKPISDKRTLYLDTQKAIARTSNAIETRWNALVSDIRLAIPNNDDELLHHLFDDALELIPDANDPRHQKIATHKQRLIQEALKKKEGRRG